MDVKTFEKKAIQFALEGNWPQAVKTNLELLKENPKDADTLNRLAFALFQTGDFAKAEKKYQQVLELDKHNPIATKNLARLRHQNKSKTSPSPKPTKISASSFIEESGRTKIISLARTAGPQVLAHINCSDQVQLVPKKKFISVYSPKKDYLGIIPDNISCRLLKLIKAGNRYEALVKDVADKNIQILVKEIYRSAKLKNTPSFSSSGLNYIPYLSPGAIEEERPQIDLSREEESEEE